MDSPKWMPLARRYCLVLISWVSESNHEVIKPLIAERQVMQAPATATAVTPPQCRTLQG